MTFEIKKMCFLTITVVSQHIVLSVLILTVILFYRFITVLFSVEDVHI